MKFIFHIPIALVLIVLGAVIVTIFVVTQTTLVHRGINMLLAQYIESRYNVKVEYGNIGGSLFEYLTVDNVRVDFEKSPHRYRLLNVKRIEAYYNINNLWHGNWHLDSLLIEQPTLVLRSDSSGAVLIPEFGGNGQESKPSALRIAIDHYRVDNGRFQWFKLPSAYYVDSISLAGSLLLDKGDIKAAVDTVLLNYPEQDFHIRSLHCDLTLANKILNVDSLVLVTDSSKIFGDGGYSLDSTGAYKFAFTNSRVCLWELSNVTGLSLLGDIDFSAKVAGKGLTFGGNADLNGSFFDRLIGPVNIDYSYDNGVLNFRNLKGQAFDGDLSGSIEMNLVARPETYSGDLAVTGINLDKILPNTFKSKVNGILQISGSGLGGNSFNIDLNVRAGRGSFDFVNYDSLEGTISANTTDMYFHPGFSLNYKHSRFTTEGVVDYTGEMGLTGDFTTTQLQDFWGDLFIKKLSGTGRGNFVVTGNNRDPDIRGEFYGDSCSFYGLATDSLRASFDIGSFLYRRVGSVKLKAFSSDVWTLPADSLIADVKIDSNVITIDTAVVYDPRYSMAGKAVAIVADSTASVQVSDFAFTFDSLRYYNTAPIPVEFLVDRIVVDTARIRGDEGALNIYCDYGYDSTIVLRVETDSFAVAPWLKELSVDSALTGTLKMDGEMTGKLKLPHVKLEGIVPDLAFGRDSIGTLAAKLHFEDSTVTFDDLVLNFKGGSATATGKFPFIMNLDSGLAYVPQQPMELTVKSSGNDLSILSSLNENIESLSGDYDLQLDVYGTPHQPQTKGFFNLKNGAVKIYQMENPIQDLQAEVTSQDKLVKIEWAEGKARYKGKEGTLRAAGTILIRNLQTFYYDIDIVGFDVPIKYDLGDIYGLCDADLEIKGDNPPKITGDVTVKEATYYEDFATQAVSTAIEAADTVATWDYIIHLVMLPGSVIVKNSDVNMVVDGDLYVERLNAKDNYLGTININRGSYYLGDLTFKIGEGSQLIYQDIKQPDPTLAITASAQLPNYGANVGGSATNTLDLVVTNTLSAPKFSAASGSNYSDQDILTLILMNQSASASANDPFATTALQNRIQVGGIGMLGNLLGRRLSRTFGVEKVEINPTYGSKNNVTGAEFTLGLYTLPNVYTYVNSLSLDGSAEYGAEYHLGRHLFLAGSLNRDKLWNLNLNLKWEFK